MNCVQEFVTGYDVIVVNAILVFKWLLLMLKSKLLVEVNYIFSFLLVECTGMWKLLE